MSSQPTSAQYTTGILFLYLSGGKSAWSRNCYTFKTAQPLTCPYQTKMNPLARAKTYPTHLTWNMTTMVSNKKISCIQFPPVQIQKINPWICFCDRFTKDTSGWKSLVVRPSFWVEDSIHTYDMYIMRHRLREKWQATAWFRSSLGRGHYIYIRTHNHIYTYYTTPEGSTLPLKKQRCLEDEPFLCEYC